MDTEVNQQIADLKSQLYTNQQELIALDKNIEKVKMLQFKASTILKNAEKKLENDNSELEAINVGHKKFICMKNKITTEIDLEDPNIVEKLQKQVTELEEKLLEVKTFKRNLASKIYKMKLEIAEQEKKNDAELLELQKHLDSLREEEKYLLSIINS